MSVKQVAVVIPFYRDTLTGHEDIALKQCALVLAKYPIIAIKPQSLTLPDNLKDYPFEQVINFDDSYFASIQGYNKLMLDAHFYQAFLNYEYILIHQLDAFVFEDKLSYWCTQNLDYIGAPWLRKKDTGTLKSTLLKVQQYFSIRFDLKKQGLPNKYQFENQVGNGGFSLRKVKKFYNLCISMKPRIDLYLSRNEHQYHEDTFWSIEVNRKKHHINICDYQTALRFAFENSPDRALKLNNNELPFGCHAWDKHPGFWRPIFKEHGFTI
jgi:hypothetical protein